MKAEEGTQEVDWVERYEGLRAHALGGAPVAYVPLGLGVLRSRGVVGWMRTEREAAGRRLLAVPVREEGREEGRADPLKAELVRLLAGAALLTMERRAR